MKKLDFNNWNELRDFIESKTEKYISLTTHIDILRAIVKDILETELKEGVKITKENIHLYYEFMNDEDLTSISSSFLSDMLLKRQHQVVDSIGDSFFEKWYLKVDITSIPYIIKSTGCVGYKDIKRSFFGVKDTLKPIEEYIKEIKESEQYKEHIADSSIRKPDLIIGVGIF